MNRSATRRRATATVDSPRRLSPPRTAVDVARGAAAFVVLLLCCVGIPWILLGVAPLGPLSVPTWAGVSGALTRPDDGHLFLSALGVLAWLAWLVFTTSVVLEAVAVIRGLPTPRLPLLGSVQRPAAALVAAAAVLLSSHPLATTVDPPRASGPALTTVAFTTSSASSGRGIHEAAPDIDLRDTTADHHAAAPPAKQRTQQRTVTVRRGDTLWSLAETHLGSGSRFREIASLNYGRRQPDGRALTDTHWIYPGWVLVMPGATATRPTAAAPNQGHSGQTHADTASYTVRHGDSLWSIAQHHLGDGARYREIDHLNKDKPQRVGGSLTDPDVILPGWILRLPAPRHHAAPTRTTTPAVAAHPRPTVPPAAPPTAAPSTQQSAPPRTAPGSARVPVDSGPASPETGASTGTDHRGATSDVTPVADGADDPGVPIHELVLGLTVLTAAGFLAELARRRRNQQRLRRAGRRISMPAPEPAAAEVTLRAAQDPNSLASLTDALDAMSALCRDTGRAMPRILAAVLSRESLELVVVDDGDPVAPFVATDSGRWRWDPTARTDAGADFASASRYPALVTIGVAADAVVLVNLEAAGTLTISGAEGAARDVLRALALELATSALNERSVLILPPAMAEVAMVSDACRVCSADPDAAARRARTHLTSVAGMLRDAGVIDLHDARAHDVLGDASTPLLLVTAGPVDAAPWSGVAAITTEDAATTGWTLTVDEDGRAQLADLGFELLAQRLTEVDYDALISVLRASCDTDVVESEPVVEDDDAAVDAIVYPATAAALESTRHAVVAALPRPPMVLWEEADQGPSGPRALLLGRPQIVGTTDDVARGRRGRATELLAYLALHPGASANEIDEALWPGQRVTKDARNSVMSRARSWLGTDSDGEPHLALVGENGDYRLHGVSSDWSDFLDLARAGLSAEVDELGVLNALEQAMSLVRARPFLGIDPATYLWAEADTQEMISTIVDVAHVLSLTHLSQGNFFAAQEAATRGLLVDPVSELLHCDAIRAAHARGDDEEALRLSDRLRTQVGLIDPDLDLSDESIELLTRIARR